MRPQSELDNAHLKESLCSQRTSIDPSSTSEIYSPIIPFTNHKFRSLIIPPQSQNSNSSLPQSSRRKHTNSSIQNHLPSHRSTADILRIEFAQILQRYHRCLSRARTHERYASYLWRATFVGSSASNAPLLMPIPTSMAASTTPRLENSTY